MAQSKEMSSYSWPNGAEGLESQSILCDFLSGMQTFALRVNLFFSFCRSTFLCQ